MYSIIKFGRIMMNNGNHYHPADGVFVAPISGVYMLACNTLTLDNNYLFTELRVENEVKGTVGSRGANHLYIPGSTSLLCHVRKGDHVWVQTSGVFIYIIGMNLRHSWDFCFRKINFVGLYTHPRPTHSQTPRTHLFDIESLNGKKENVETYILWKPHFNFR
jgi:hypothetical protein